MPSRLRRSMDAESMAAITSDASQFRMCFSRKIERNVTFRNISPCSIAGVIGLCEQFREELMTECSLFRPNDDKM